MEESTANNSVQEVPELTARDYQIELLHKAVERNIIVCLGTGTGKTFVSVLLIKEMLWQTEPDHGKKKTLFLAPTVPLVSNPRDIIELEITIVFGWFTFYHLLGS